MHIDAAQIIITQIDIVHAGIAHIIITKIDIAYDDIAFGKRIGDFV